MTATAPERVSIADGWLWLFRLGCPALGFGLAFGIRPLVDWLSDLLGGMPGWVEFIADQPQVWAILVLTLLGAGVGLWLADEAKREAPELKVDRHTDLDDEVHALLRARGRAIEDKKPAHADELHEQLQQHGIVVRDRNGEQQYRRR